MMGSSHVYDMASAVPGALKKVSALRDNYENNLTRLIIILLLYRHLVHPMKGSR